MSPDYEKNRKWSDQFIPHITRIVGPLLINPAEFKQDAIQATDLIVLTARDMRIAARVRRHGYAAKYPWQFTLRARLDSGAETELVKIIDGWGDWFFYGHADERNEFIDRWMVLSLNAFRAALIRDVKNNSTIICGDKNNGDGTSFKWFDVRSFPNPSELIVASSHDLKAREAA